MPVLLVANAHKDTDVEQYLSSLSARSNRRCSVYVRHKEGNHTQPSHAFPILVCDIESWNPHITTSTWPASDKPAVIVHDATAPDVEEIILEAGSNLDSITYLEQIADLLVAFREATKNAQDRLFLTWPGLFLNPFGSPLDRFCCFRFLGLTGTKKQLSNQTIN